MKNIEEQYLDLLKDILENGVKKTDRTGTGTLSVFGRQIRHKMSDGFPLLTTKKMAWKSMVVELLWFLNGDTNIRYLVDNNCNIWNGDAYKRYSVIADVSTQVESLTRDQFVEKIKTDIEFAKKWGDLGSIYGAQWRSWKEYKWDRLDMEFHIEYIDQIANLINDLKTNPDSRRLMVNAWNVAEIDSMVLPPCHYGFQVYTRELTLDERLSLFKNNVMSFDELSKATYDEFFKKNNIPTRAISLIWNQRSVDTPLGLPFNIASYALLLEIIGKMVNMVPDELIGNLGDTHIYLNQVEGVKEQINRKPLPFPKLIHMKTDSFYKSLSEDISLFSHLDTKDFKLENYVSHPKIDFPLSN